MGHEGCCAECATKIDELSVKVDRLSVMAEAFAESVSKIGSSPMARGALKSMGINLGGE